MKLLFGLIIIALGIVIMKYRYQIYNITGDWSWAIRYLGGNGTITAISLIGMLLVGVGAAYPLGAFDHIGGAKSLHPPAISTSSSTSSK